MPNIAQMIKDPRFLALPEAEQVTVLQTALGQKAAAPELGESGLPVAQAAPEADAGVGPIIPGESISAVTGEPVTAQELPPDREIDLAATEQYVRPALETGGLLAGGALAAPVGPVGAVAGGGLGYAAGKGAADILYGDQAETLPEQLAEAGKDVLTGAAMEAGGMGAGAALGKGIEGLGYVGKRLLGRTTGKGLAAIEQAIKRTPDFVRALRGKITGEEIVQNTHGALQGVKDIRSSRYVDQLDKIKVMPEKLLAIRDSLSKKLQSLISKDKFDIKTTPSPEGVSFDFSGSTLVESQPVINKALQDITKWDDFTAKGFDTLKKRLGTYTRQVKKGTPQEAFLSQLEQSVSQGLKKNVPGYEKMTKEYREVSNLIKDIESGLMMRKEGMTGRITADQTLRRLMSAMKDNFKLRNDLVKALTESGGKDIEGQVAGYAMKDLLPSGIGGSGPAVAASTLMSFMNPKFIPVLLASSPRVASKFLQLVGKELPKTKAAARLAPKAAAYLALKPTDEEITDLKKE